MRKRAPSVWQHYKCIHETSTAVRDANFSCASLSCSSCCIAMFTFSPPLLPVSGRTIEGSVELNNRKLYEIFRTGWCSTTTENCSRFIMQNRERFRKFEKNSYHWRLMFCKHWKWKLAIWQTPIRSRWYQVASIAEMHAKASSTKFFPCSILSSIALSFSNNGA